MYVNNYDSNSKFDETIVNIQKKSVLVVWKKEGVN